jgi:hypothetical protein
MTEELYIVGVLQPWFCEKLLFEEELDVPGCFMES